MANPLAEVIDTFFNGRPAPKDAQVLRVLLTKKQIQQLQNGATLRFAANNIQILIVPPVTLPASMVCSKCGQQFRDCPRDKK
jgi:hypothetical protein